MPGLLLGNTVNIFGGMLTVVDERVLGSVRAQWSSSVGRQAVAPWANGVLWTSNRGLGGQFGGNIAGDASTDASTWGIDPLDEVGGQQAKKIIGTTLDSTGAPLGSCVIQGFVTATDVYVGQVVSDSAGYYELPTQYVGQSHYIVAYKAGSPDVAGTSVNTLVPA
jgi:hypothetical protein